MGSFRPRYAVLRIREFSDQRTKKRSRRHVSSEFPSCAPQQPNAQPDRNVYVVPLMRSPHLRREKTKAIQNSGRCSSVAALELQACGFIVAHADKCFIDINWMYGDRYESSYAGRHFLMLLKEVSCAPRLHLFILKIF